MKVYETVVERVSVLGFVSSTWSDSISTCPSSKSLDKLAV